MNKSFVFLADGFEEIEALTVVDVMRRAGLDVVTVSINNDKKVTGAHGIEVNADCLYGEADLADALWLICPGGMPGASNLYNFLPMCDAITAHNEKKGKIAAICAAPAVVFAQLGILQGKKATCYPGFESGLEAGGATVSDERVVVCDNVITANGPATATDFALTIVKATSGEKVAADVAAGMLKK